MEKSESIASLAEALAKSQAEMRNPAFDSVNPHFKSKYASLSSVRDAVIPALSKHGISIIQIAMNTESGVAVQTILMHSSGEWISSTFSVPVQKGDAHGFGSALKYSRRYALESMVCVSGDEDDDGNAAIAKPSAPVQIIPQPNPMTEAPPKKNGNGSKKLAEVKENFKRYASKYGRDEAMNIVRSVAGDGINKSEDIHPEVYQEVIDALKMETS